MGAATPSSQFSKVNALLRSRNAKRLKSLARSSTRTHTRASVLSDSRANLRLGPRDQDAFEAFVVAQHSACLPLEDDAEGAGKQTAGPQCGEVVERHGAQVLDQRVQLSSVRQIRSEATGASIQALLELAMRCARYPSTWRSAPSLRRRIRRSLARCGANLGQNLGQRAGIAWCSPTVQTREAASFREKRQTPSCTEGGVGSAYGIHHRPDTTLDRITFGPELS